MITGQRRFETGIESSTAILPSPPAHWSFSSLKEVGTCPRRYALFRASYPDLWDRRGYPQIPAPAALFGDIVHDALDTIVKAIAAAGCESAQSPEAVTVLRKLGGFTPVIERAAEDRLADLQNNPRLSDDLQLRIRRGLHGRISDARVQVQGYISKAIITPNKNPSHAWKPADTSVPGRRAPLPLGSHAETTLMASGLRLRGRVDLIRIAESGAHITDYKTGGETPSHAEQLRLYALLWNHDLDANPLKRPVATLTAAYPGSDIAIPVPDESELHAIEEHTAASIEAADAELSAVAPRAVPSAQNCGNCGVRHLCDAYWSSVAPDPTVLPDQTKCDCQGVVGARNGQHSWWFHPEGGAPKTILIRTPPTGPDLPAGQRVRILGLHIDTDPETGTTVASMNLTTEVFRLI